MITTLSEHSFDPEYFTDGICIDVGCRGFGFSQVMHDMGLKVYAIDIEQMTPPDGIKFLRKAISNRIGTTTFNANSDPQATNIHNLSDTKASQSVDVITLNQLYYQLELVNIDILKLDCEGSEYHILSDNYFEPVPRQISIEFHEHAQKELHDRYYDKCMENLLKYYIPIRHERTDQHCAGFNYWDSLFIRKDIAR